MPFPEEFDYNEIFVIICIFLFFSIAVFLPKKLPLSITILIMLFGILLARFADHLMASPTVNFYDIMDTGKLELFDIILYLLYAPFAYFHIYVYESFKIRGLIIPMYIAIFLIFAAVFEWTNVMFGVFQYKSWELRYSIIVYLISQILLLLFYELMKRNYKSDSNNH